jgi:hypothetical protein
MYGFLDPFHVINRDILIQTKYSRYFVFEASWRRHHGGIVEEAAWRRHRGGGTIEEASWRRHLGSSEVIWRSSGVI